ncbi:MAG: AraC family transcriptional regulator [Pseudomonadota bacterium]
MSQISDLFEVFRLNAKIFHNAQYCGEWSVDTSGGGWASFHLITHGNCWVESDTGIAEVTKLSAGDIVIFPRDASHVMHPNREAAAEVNSSTSLSFDKGLDADGVGLLCGHLQMRHATANPLLSDLPAVVVWRASTDEWTKALSTLITMEAVASNRGGDAILNRLCEALFIHIVSSRSSKADSLDRLAAAVSDPRIGRVLDELHENPGESWTLPRMADVAAMSRSAFSDKFKSLLHQSPMTYLVQWRMQQAVLWLREEGAPIAVVAERCGYDNESSFSKAFRKVMGEPPGAIRRAV